MKVSSARAKCAILCSSNARANYARSLSPLASIFSSSQAASRADSAARKDSSAGGGTKPSEGIPSSVQRSTLILNKKPAPLQPQAIPGQLHRPLQEAVQIGTGHQLIGDRQNRQQPFGDGLLALLCPLEPDHPVRKRHNHPARSQPHSQKPQHEIVYAGVTLPVDGSGHIHP